MKKNIINQNIIIDTLNYRLKSLDLEFLNLKEIVIAKKIEMNKNKTINRENKEIKKWAKTKSKNKLLNNNTHKNKTYKYKIEKK